MKRSIVSVLTALAIVGISSLPSVAYAQRGGGGQGGGNKAPRCVDDPFFATLSFEAHPDGPLPAVYPSIVGAENGMAGAFLTTNFGSGNIAGELEGAGDLPLTLDFSRDLGTNHYGTKDGHASGEPTPIDPWVSTSVFTDDDTFADVDCDMLGMEIGEQYRMRLTVQWWERDGVPVPRAEDTNGRWVLQFKPFLMPDENLTWVNAVRTHAGIWVLTTRTASDPLHKAALERTARGKGRGKEPATYSNAGMPFQLVITLSCGADCPLPGSGG